MVSVIQKAEGSSIDPLLLFHSFCSKRQDFHLVQVTLHTSTKADTYVTVHTQHPCVFANMQMQKYEPGSMVSPACIPTHTHMAQEHVMFCILYVFFLYVQYISLGLHGRAVLNTLPFFPTDPPFCSPHFITCLRIPTHKPALYITQYLPVGEGEG